MINLVARRAAIIKVVTNRSQKESAQPLIYGGRRFLQQHSKG